MKAGDLRAMTVDQLDDEVLKLKKERFNLRFQRATGQLENTSRVRVVRRDIARVKTLARHKADFSIVKAWKGDRFGNLVYRKTTRNFNPMIAAAGDVTVAEVEILVEPGELDPDQIHTPGIYVQRVIKGAKFEKPIEQRTVRKRSSGETRSA